MRFLFSIVIFMAVFTQSCTLKKINQINIEEAPANLEEPVNVVEEKFVIAFGSCSNQEKEQPLWKDIIAEQADLWIWLGDNIYANTKSDSVFEAKYAKQNSHKDYQQLKANTSIIGTWDDHDYGKNDGDKTFDAKAKQISRDKALQFLEVPKTNKVWQREGLYQSYNYNFNNLMIRVILLDTRYFKTPVTKGPNGYIPDEKADLLGKAQWKWLEEELTKKEDILIIGNGTQIIPQDHKYEKWANYPTSRDRFLNLLKNEATKNIILLSGDRHIGEISKIELSNKTIYEVTSSGLTHSWESVGEETNRHRVGKLMPQLNYGIIEITNNAAIKLMISGQAQKRHLEVKL